MTVRNYVLSGIVVLTCMTTAPVLDVCWRDDSVLASCSSDHSLAVCNVNDTKPLHRLKVCPWVERVGKTDKKNLGW